MPDITCITSHNIDLGSMTTSGVTIGGSCNCQSGGHTPSDPAGTGIYNTLYLLDFHSTLTIRKNSYANNHSSPTVSYVFYNAYEPVATRFGTGGFDSDVDYADSTGAISLNISLASLFAAQTQYVSDPVPSDPNTPYTTYELVSGNCFFSMQDYTGRGIGANFVPDCLDGFSTNHFTLTA